MDLVAAFIKQTINFSKGIGIGSVHYYWNEDMAKKREIIQAEAKEYLYSKDFERFCRFVGVDHSLVMSKLNHKRKLHNKRVSDGLKRYYKAEARMNTYAYWQGKG